MSFNRLMYDSCSYKKSVEESTGTLSYMLNPIKFENCSKCRVEFGVIGGSNVSHTKGQLVDTESELRNITRVNSKCPTKKYIPKCDAKSENDNGLPCGPYQLAEKHLKPCTWMPQRPRIDNVGYNLVYPSCSHAPTK